MPLKTARRTPTDRRTSNPWDMHGGGGSAQWSRSTVTVRDTSDPSVAPRLQSHRPLSAAARASARLLEILERTVKYVVGCLDSGDPWPGQGRAPTGGGVMADA